VNKSEDMKEKVLFVLEVKLGKTHICQVQDYNHSKQASFPGLSM
jgi:hypothetical protein